MSGLCSWTGREFSKRCPLAAKVLLSELLSVRGTGQAGTLAEETD